MFDIDSPEVLQKAITNKQTTAKQIELFGNVQRYFVFLAERWHKLLLKTKLQPAKLLPLTNLKIGNAFYLIAESDTDVVKV